MTAQYRQSLYPTGPGSVRPGSTKESAGDDSLWSALILGFLILGVVFYMDRKKKKGKTLRGAKGSAKTDTPADDATVGAASSSSSSSSTSSTSSATATASASTPAPVPAAPAGKSGKSAKHADKSQAAAASPAPPAKKKGKASAAASNSPSPTKGSASPDHVADKRHGDRCTLAAASSPSVSSKGGCESVGHEDGLSLPSAHTTPTTSSVPSSTCSSASTSTHKAAAKAVPPPCPAEQQAVQDELSARLALEGQETSGQTVHAGLFAALRSMHDKAGKSRDREMKDEAKRRGGIVEEELKEQAKLKRDEDRARKSEEKKLAKRVKKEVCTDAVAAAVAAAAAACAEATAAAEAVVAAAAASAAPAAKKEAASAFKRDGAAPRTERKASDGTVKKPPTPPPQFVPSPPSTPSPFTVPVGVQAGVARPATAQIIHPHQLGTVKAAAAAPSPLQQVAPAQMPKPAHGVPQTPPLSPPRAGQPMPSAPGYTTPAQPGIIVPQTGGQGFPPADSNFPGYLGGQMPSQTPGVPFQGTPATHNSQLPQPQQPPLSMCPEDKHCKLINDPVHQGQFRHTCRVVACAYARESWHTRLFAHPDRSDTGITVYETENLSGVAMPGQWNKLRVHKVKELIARYLNIPAEQQMLTTSSGALLRDATMACEDCGITNGATLFVTRMPQRHHPDLLYAALRPLVCTHHNPHHTGPNST